MATSPMALADYSESGQCGRMNADTKAANRAWGGGRGCETHCCPAQKPPYIKPVAATAAPAQKAGVRVSDRVCHHP